MTTATPQAVLAPLPPFASARRLLSHAAYAIQPLLNRVVFTGRLAGALLATGGSPFSPRSIFGEDAVLRLLSNSTLDRIGADLQRLGLRRGARTAEHDQWSLEPHVTLEVTYVSGDDDNAGTIWLEYASLLTMAVELGDGLVARVTGAPALLALAFAEFRTSRESALDSAELDDAIVLVASRPELVREVGASPPEVRAFVAQQARWLVGHDGVGHLVRCAIPSHAARRLDGLAERVIERLRSIAALA